MSILVKKGDHWLSIKNIYTYQKDHWNIIKEVYVNKHNKWQSIWQDAIIYINDIPKTSISIFETMGSPSKAGNYVFINNAEINADYGNQALKTGTFPEKSQLTIINNSYIRGYGGNGGKGLSDGSPGGDALLLEYPCTINNNNGYLFSGGGGGGGFWVTFATNGSIWYSLGGSGGAGSIPGITTEGLAGTTASNTSVVLPSNGTINLGGSFGQTLFSGKPTATYRSGTGGAPGENGGSAFLYSGGGKISHKLYAGGAAGLAINKNNFEVKLININKDNIKGEIR